MDAQTLEILHKVFQTVDQQTDWKLALDALLASMRHQFVYDNVAVYLLDSESEGLEVVYARAVGRGKTGEADVAWGQGIAGEVIEHLDGNICRCTGYRTIVEAVLAAAARMREEADHG